MFDVTVWPIETVADTSHGKPRGVLPLGMLTMIASVLVIVADFAYPVEDANSQAQALRDIAETVAAIRHPSSGRGTAIVATTDTIFGDQVNIVEFVFKEEHSMSKRFAISPDGNKGALEITWAKGPLYSVSFSNRSVLVTPRPAKQFFRQLGFDFHPDTFLWIHDRPLAKIDRLAMSPARVVLSTDSNDLLNVVGHYSDSNQDHDIIWSLDPAKGYRLVRASEHMTRKTNPRQDVVMDMEVTWASYGASWYPSSGRQEDRVWDEQNQKNLTRIIEFSVLDFSPGAQVQDSDFSVEELDVPVGTSVVNRVTGESYVTGPDGKRLPRE